LKGEKMKGIFWAILLAVLLAVLAANTFYLYRVHNFLASHGELRRQDTFKEKVLQSLEDIQDKLKGK